MSFHWRKISGSELPLGLIYAVISILAVAGARLAVDGVAFDGYFCPFKLITGLPCPTCGLTRAFAAVSHLDFATALAQNPLMVIALVGVWIWGLVSLTGVVHGGRVPRIRANKGAATAMRIFAVAAIAANWAYLIAAGV